MLHSHRLFSHFSPLSPSAPFLPHRFPSAHRHTLQFSLSSPNGIRAAGPHPWLAELPEPSSPPPPPPPPPSPSEGEEGPMEILTSKPPVFSVDDNPSPLQVTTSVLLTGAISVFLFRSLRRRAKRAKELRVRSSGVTKAKDLKEEALEKLKAIGAAPVEADEPPSPVQALLGGIGAGVIALILYKFTATIESALDRQAISDNFSVRQITITIRTIVNGLCYLATFVFGINSVGLILYSVQLTLSSIMGNFSNNSKSDTEAQQNPTLSKESTTNSAEGRSEDFQDTANGT